MKHLIWIVLLTSLCFGQHNNAHMLSGVNYQTGTSYTLVPADATRTVVLNNANPVAVTLPSGMNAGFQAGHVFVISNLGAGSVVITCSGCTINGSATLGLSTNQSADIYSDGVNYIASLGGGGGGGGGSPGGLDTQVQVRNGSAFGAITNVSPGSVLASQGSASIPIFQQKPQIDVRDYGTFGDNTTHAITQGNINSNTQWLGCGTATVVGTAMTWNTGAKFYPTLAGVNINWNGADIAVSSVGTITAGVATSLTLGSAPGDAGPARWCMYSTGDQWDYVGLQESIFASLGAPGSEHSTGLSYLNRAIIIPSGSYLVNKTLNITHGAGVHIAAAQRFSVTIKQRTNATAILTTNGLSWSRIEGIFWRPDAGVTSTGSNPLLEINWDGSSSGWTGGFQANTFAENFFSAEGANWGIGLRLAGSGFQGSENLFLNDHFMWFNSSCFVEQNFNALQNTFIGGNFQNCSGDGIHVSAGNVIVYSVGFQNGTPATNPAQTGWDINILSSANDTNTIKDCRTESANFIRQTSGARIIANGNHQTPPVSNFWLPNQGYLLNQTVRPPPTSTKVVGGAFRVTTPGTSGAVEPDWTYTTTTDNTVGWTYMPNTFISVGGPAVIDNNVIEGGSSITNVSGATYDVNISNNSFSHKDWLNPNGTSPFARQNTIARICQNQVWQGGGPNNGTLVQYSTMYNQQTTNFLGWSFCDFGSQPILWSTIKSTGIVNDDAGLGPIANMASATGSGSAPQDTGVAVIGTATGINPVFGRVDANGADQAGIDQRIGAGRSTGSGLGGSILLQTSSAAGSSSTLNALVTRWQIPSTGHFLAFADNTYDIGAAGATRPRTGYFGTSVSAPQLVSTVATGTPPLVIASTDNVANLNASSLNGNTFASPGPIGGTTPDQVTTTQLNVTGTGAFAVTAPAGTLPTPGASTGGIGIGPGAVPAFNPNNAGWFNIPLMQDCGTTTTCAKTPQTLLIVRGSVAFPTATTVTVTALPFTSSTSYSCTAGDVTTAAGVINATTYTSGSAVTFTETGGANTDTARYICAGF